VKAYYASPGEKSDYIGKQDYTEIQVTLPIYAVACVSLVGWVFFAMFAGVGLVALPIDLMHTFTDRPTSIDVKNWAAKRNELKERAAKLRAIGEKMEKENFTSVKLTRNDQKLFNKFKNAVYLLEKDYEILRVRKFEKGGNILYYIGMGILGVIGVFVSLLWVIHTVLFVFMHNAHPFLNTLLVGLDNVFPLFGTVGFGTFAFYLLWWCVSFLLIRHSAHMPAQPHACLHTSVLACSSPGASSVSVCHSTIKGVMKMGIRFAFFTIHPMEPGKTMMNSFLFNVGIILLCEIPVIQFCSSAFSIYARVTSISMLFGTQIRYIKGFDFMFQYNIFLYIFFAFIALTSLYMAVKKPKDSGKEIEKSISEELELKGMYS
jgi:LMBR1 domain-containing protein 1